MRRAISDCRVLLQPVAAAAAGGGGGGGGNVRRRRRRRRRREKEKGEGGARAGAGQREGGQAGIYLRVCYVVLGPAGPRPWY
jgi:hypothetical protein